MEVRKLWIHLSDEDSRPLYVQLKEQIVRDILNGTVKPGEELPSIRRLAKEARTSVITVKRAYQDLEQAGYIFTRAGKGTFVKEQLDEKIQERNREDFKEKVNELIHLGRSYHLSNKTMLEMISSLLHGGREK